MATVESIAALLDQLAPPALAEDWDNVGLLVGDPQAPAARVMTCLTITGDTVAEAVDGGADLVVTHHPLPFRPLNRITTATAEGRYLLQLVRAGIAIYSAHTAFDSTAGGINQRLAEGIGLRQIAPLRPHEEDVQVGAGRCGTTEPNQAVQDVAVRLKQFLDIQHVRLVGDPRRIVARVAVACGSAGEFLQAAQVAGCDALVTGETSFHTCLAAEAEDVALLLVGHFASERFAMNCLADLLDERFSDVQSWASREERDPLRWI